MGWRVELSPLSRKQINSLPASIRNRILSFLRDRVVPSQDPAKLGRWMVGAWVGHFRLRVGDYRIVCRLKSGEITVLVVTVGHRSSIYDR